MPAEATATSTIRGVANRVAQAVGFDPSAIIAIITALIQAFQNCKKPANKSEAVDALADGYRNHARKCPIWFRGCFRQNGVKDIDDIHDMWAAIMADAHAHQAEVAGALVA